MSEESRLGREAIETAYALKQLVRAGVRVFFYLEDRERTLDSPTDKLLMSVTAFSDELEREKARQRTYDAMQRKARAGHVTGGRVFGYDNVEIVAGEGRRSHVERRIYDDEAAVVRRIFELCALGAGLTRITKTLNAERVPAPRPQQGRPRAWVASSVRAVLLRPLYRGEVVWNQTKKRDRWVVKPSARMTDEWLRVPAPTLRIVSDDLWAARAQGAGRPPNTVRAGRWRPPKRRHRCEVPARQFRPVRVLWWLVRRATRQVGGGRRAAFYGCSAAWKRGSAVCANTLVGRVDAIDDEVIATLREDVFRPAFA